MRTQTPSGTYLFDIDAVRRLPDGGDLPRPGVVVAILFVAFGLLWAGCGVGVPGQPFVGGPEDGHGEDVDMINVFEETPAAQEQAALPVREADYVCPEGARRVVSDAGDGRVHCLFEGLALPAGEGLTPVCQYLNRQYVGFGWDEGTAQEGYACPDGATHASNDDGQELCLFDNLPLPLADGLRPECFGLKDGVVGFSWVSASEDVE